jgi:curli biogenesis system outer membrane secretion channel CsgG
MKHSLWLLLLASLINLQCGYRLTGWGRNLPAAAQTITIPEFKNTTSHYQAGRFITVAIKEEFIKRSHLRLNESIDNADLLLEGIINAFETAPISYSTFGAAHLSEIRITLTIRLIDMKKNELFYETTGQVFRETYETDASDFFSQGTESQDEIAAKIASSVVASILDNF